MDMPADKMAVVMGSSETKKWQVVREHSKRRRQPHPMEYLSRLCYVMEAEGKKSQRRAAEHATIQALQGLEISLRTNNIR